MYTHPFVRLSRNLVLKWSFGQGIDLKKVNYVVRQAHVVVWDETDYTLSVASSQPTNL